MTQPDLSALADTAFSELEATLQGSPQLLGKYRAIQMHKQRLELAADSTAASLSAINELPAFAADERDYKTKLALDIWDSTDKASTRGLEEGFEALKAELEKEAQANLTPSGDSAGRQLIRQEIDALIANSPGLPVSTLLRLAQDRKYTTEIQAYGPALLTKWGMPERIPELQRGILAVASERTPSAAAAVAALKKLDRARGHVAGIAFTARQRVQASQPRKSQNSELRFAR